MNLKFSRALKLKAADLLDCYDAARVIFNEGAPVDPTRDTSGLDTLIDILESSSQVYQRTEKLLHLAKTIRRGLEISEK